MIIELYQNKDLWVLYQQKEVINDFNHHFFVT